MELVTDPAALDAFVGGHLVPTMGALHEGHASLIRRARDAAEAAVRSGTALRRAHVVATVFVNPTQFAPHEDFDRYPRALDADMEIAHAAGADAVFAPPVDAIYPRGLEAAQRDAAALELPLAATEPGLEDRARPGHFGGVCLVVARLFELCRPRRAFFGEKDWQQLRVVAQMVERARRAGGADALLPRFPDLEIVGCPTVREADGLALSSRNRYLRPEARRRATALWRAIEAARAVLVASRRAGSTAAAVAPTPPAAPAAPSIIAAAERRARDLLNREGLSVDYAVIRDPETLLPPPSDAAPGTPLRILIAARLGDVRLIDNAPLNL